MVDEAAANEPVVYLLSYVNSGDAPATGVVVIETVPDHTTFHAALSTPGWSCADGSLPGTACSFFVGTVPANSVGTLMFAVMVDDPPGTVEIFNQVTITSDGGTDEDDENTPIFDPAPAPTLSPLVLGLSLVILLFVAHRRWGRVTRR
jgi:uncharacterized repeat protein (TIGR01451 family)